MPYLEISAPLTLMWLFGRLFMDIIVSVTVYELIDIDTVVVVVVVELVSYNIHR